MTQVFENPAYLRAMISDMKTGEETAKNFDRWAYIDNDCKVYTHPTERGADRLAGTRGETLFTLHLDFGTAQSGICSNESEVLRDVGKAYHENAKIKPDLTIRDNAGKIVATMDRWALDWAEAAA